MGDEVGDVVMVGMTGILKGVISGLETGGATGVATGETSGAAAGEKMGVFIGVASGPVTGDAMEIETGDDFGAATGEKTGTGAFGDATGTETEMGASMGEGRGKLVGATPTPDIGAATGAIAGLERGGLPGAKAGFLVLLSITLTVTVVLSNIKPFPFLRPCPVTSIE
jgi:hypothetical protein